MADALQISIKLMERHAKRIGVQDGANKSALREWLEDISSAKEWCAASDSIVLANVGCLVKGNLDTAIRDWIREYDLAGTNVTWALVRARIEGEFLDADEREHLRKKLEALRQSATQDVREFAREFDRASKLAYSLAELAVPVLLERIIRMFVAALRDANVRMMVYMGRPATLDEAYKVGHSADRARSLAMDDRVEEPMEIGATRGAITPQDSKLDKVLESIQALEIGAVKQAAIPKATEIDGLKQSIKAMQDKINALEGKPRPFRPHKRGRGVGPRTLRRGGQLGWTPDDRPICWGCGQAGHLQRQCGRQGN